MRYDYIFFDLDGTLSDPAQGICGSIQYALEKGGYPVGPMEKYHAWIGPPLLRSFEVYLNATPEEAQRLLALYRERFSVTGLFENVIYPGIPELLRELKAAGATLMVATGKPTVYARQILEHFGILDCFASVSGISLDNEPLDKCGVIAEAMRQVGVSDKRRCVMVGDRDHDVQGARMSHMDCISVLYGYGSREELEVASPTYLVESVEELRSLLLA